MDLQLLASDLTKADDLFSSLKPLYEEAINLGDIITEADIDLANKVLSGTGVPQEVSRLMRVNVEGMTSHANVLKPYINLGTDFFFI